MVRKRGEVCKIFGCGEGGVRIVNEGGFIVADSTLGCNIEAKFQYQGSSHRTDKKKSF